MKAPLMKTIHADDRKFPSVYKKVLDRLDLGEGAVDKTVRKILSDVRLKGDKAVVQYTEKFDRLKLTPAQLRVKPEQIKQAYEKADPEVVESLKYAAGRITAYHEKQK